MVKKIKNKLLSQRNTIVATTLSTLVLANFTFSTYQMVSKTVIVKIEDEEFRVKTHAKTVEQLLLELNIKLKDGDYISKKLTDKLKKFDRIEIKYKKAIKLKNTNKEEKIIKNDTNYEIKKVFKRVVVEEREIKYKTIYKRDMHLESGKEVIERKGKIGKKKIIYEEVYKNDKVEKKKVVNEIIVEKQTDEIIVQGLKESVELPSREKSQKDKIFYVESTGYTATCKGCSGVTALGIDLHKQSDIKLIAVDTNIIPLGTKVWVEGYGYAIAGDKGGAIKGNKIDVYFSSKEKALNWGRKQVKLKIFN